MQQAIDDVTRTTDPALQSASRSFDLAMNTFRSLNPDHIAERLMSERLQAMAHDSQYLGWKRAQGTLNLPHDGMVSPGSDALSLGHELFHAAVYARELARKLDEAFGGNAYTDLAQPLFVAATRIMDGQVKHGTRSVQ